MKIKTVVREVPISPYVAELWIIITNDPHYECARMNQKYKNMNLKWLDGAAACTESEFYNDNYLTVVFDAKCGYDINTICHEVIHIKNLVYKHAGVKQSSKNDEHEAYLSGWLAEQIDIAWKEYKRK